MTATINWSVDNATVASIDAAGLVFGASAGTATVTAAANGLTGIATLTVLERRVARFAYVVSEGSDSVFVYAVDAVNGALTSLPDKTVATGAFPSKIVLDPSGRFAYVTNQNGNSISAYAVDDITGGLSPISGSPFAAGSTPRFMALDAAGRFLYVSSSTDSNIIGFAIDGATGSLAPLPGSPFAAGSPQTWLGLDPSGRYLYTIRFNENAVYGFSVDPVTGQLVPLPGVPFAAGQTPRAIAFERTGRFAYVTNLSSQDLTAYSVDAVTGSLTPQPGSPYPLGGSIAVISDPTGRYLFAPVGANVAARAIDPATGALTAIAGSPFATGGTGPQAVVVDPSGHFLYLPHQVSNDVAALTISSGALAPIAGSRFAAGSRATDVGLLSTPVAVAATLVSLEVLPADASIAWSGSLQYVARGTYSDGSTRFLTASSIWSSSNQTVATISNTAGTNGRAAAIAPGTVDITATFNGISASTTLTVSAAPLVSIAITPSNPSIQFGTTQQFTATGTYADNSTADITPSAAWSSSLQAVATISNAASSVGRAAGVGVGSTVISATLGGVVGTTTLTVTAGAPVLTSLTPNQAVQGTTLDVAITGQFTNFVDGVTAAEFGGGIAVNTVSVTGPTAAIANISIAAGAAAGPRNVTLTTGAESASLPNGFTVVAVPSIASVSPDNGQQDETLDVTISGQNTHFLQGQTTVSFGADVLVNSVTVSNATTAVANITIGAEAVAGTRTVTVTTGAEILQAADAFTVLSSTVELLLISPSSGQQGQSLSVQIAGQNTHFVQDQTSATFGQGVAVSSVTINSPTSATILISIDALAGIGAREVTLATGTEFATRANGFTVQAGPARLVTMTPASAHQGEAATIQIAGELTHFLQNATVASFGTGVVIGDMIVNSPTSATVNLVVDPDASLGVRTVSLTTGGEVAALASTFQILPGIPVVNAPSPAGAPQGGSATVSFTSQFTHWVAGQTLVSFGTGVTVNQFTVLGPTSATATIAVSPTTVTGGRVVTFTTGGEIVTGTFNVTTGPAALTPLVPGSARQGESLTVELIGTATHWEQDVTTLSFAIGAPSGAIQVSQLTINSPTSATAQITVTPEAQHWPVVRVHGHEWRVDQPFKRLRRPARNTGAAVGESRQPLTGADRRRRPYRPLHELCRRSDGCRFR